jgi:hypothetical protein
MIPREIKIAIEQELDQIEANDECRILLAVESGSRAWGFSSRDSDYDVRFVYIRRLEWYLTIDLDLRRDVIERPISEALDVSGWDIRKALRLYAKSNPPLLEWLESPIVYRDAGGLRSELRGLLTQFYSPLRSTYHYLHMAQGNYRDYLKGDTVWLKKYLYALRPVLAVRWLEQERGVVPMAFDRLLETIADQPELLGDVQALVARKQAGEELDRGPAIASISRFLADELARLEGYRPAESPCGSDFGPLNALFQRMLARTWAPPN